MYPYRCFGKSFPYTVVFKALTAIQGQKCGSFETEKRPHTGNAEMRKAPHKKIEFEKRKVN